jgi:hypothetical protein
MSKPILEALDAVMPLIEKVAPMIATAVDGPLAGTAVTFLENSLGLEPGAGAQPVASLLAKATPEQLAALRTAEDNFTVKMRELHISILTLDDDRPSARARDALKDNTPAILAYVLTVGLFGFIVLMSLVSIPPSSAQALNLTLGSVGTAWVAMISYYYGSSRGSQSKDIMLYNGAAEASAGGTK